MKAVLDAVSGFDRDERQAEVRNTALVWLASRKGPCPEETIYASDVMHAYSYPGLSAGEGIETLTGCTREFAVWLFKKENHGLPPGKVAWASTVLRQDQEDTKDIKKCATEVKALLDAGRAWIAAEKTTPKGAEGWPAKPQFEARKVAMTALNECLAAPEVPWLK